MDLLVYFKYYLPDKEYKELISKLQEMLNALKNSVTQNAFDNIRGQMGIKDLNDLEDLKNLTKSPIEYNKYDTY